MKPNYYCALSFLLLYTSCVTFKQYDDRAKEARESSYEASIIKKNGETISGQVLKHKNYDSYDPNLVRVTNSDKAFTLDGTNYNDNEVVVFQDKKAFHKRFNNLFLIRLVKGKINLYYFDETGYDPTTQKNKRKSNFFFEKGGEGIIPIGISELKTAIKDNQQALDKLNSYYPKNFYSRELNIEKLVTVFKIYNE